MELSLVCSLYPCAIWNYILHLQVCCIWQPQQSDQSSSASPAELTALGIPWGTDTTGTPEQGNGMSWLVPIENSLSSLAMPSLHCVLTGMEQRSFFSSYLTGNSYLQHFLSDIFITAPRHSLQPLTSTLRISRISPCHNCTRSNGTHFWGQSCAISVTSTPGPAQQGLNQSWLLQGGRNTFSKHSLTSRPCACWLEGAAKDRWQWSK